MNILLLGTENLPFFEFLKQCGDRVQSTDKKIVLTDSLVNKSEFIISYRYRYILTKDIIEKFKMSAINIHISLLPWNRGADPNLWSFLENTPKGVTIHYLDEGIDTGDILVQQQVEFSEEETLRTSYQKLTDTAFDLFQNSWVKIKNKRLQAKPQTSDGSYHRLRDKDCYKHLLTQGWDTPIRNLIGKARIENQEQ